MALAMEPRLIDQFFDSPAQARLSRLGEVVRIRSWRDLGAADASAVLREAEILITGWGTGPITEDVLDRAPRLRAVVHSAGSVKFLVPDDWYERGILVSSQADLNAVPVAEYTVAMILLAGKSAFGAERLYRGRRAFVDPTVELTTAGNYGRRVGLVGASKIGVRAINLLAPFDLELAVYDPYLTEQRAAELGVSSVPLDELMATSAVVSLHVPLKSETRHMIGARELALLPDGATMINTARGAVIDQDALVAELRSGRIQAVIDTTDPEPVPPESELWDLPNLTLTPHIAGAIGNELFRLGDGVVTDIEEYVRSGMITKAISAEAFALLA